MENVGFAVRLKQLRKALKITQRELADELAVDVTTVSKYERGMHLPTTDILRRIAKSLNTSPGYLLEGTEDSAVEIINESLDFRTLCDQVVKLPQKSQVAIKRVIVAFLNANSK